MEHDARFMELRDRFISRSAENAARLDALMAEIRGGEVSAEAIQEIEQIAHRLAGTAGTFGFL